MAGTYVKARWSELPMEDVRRGVRRCAFGTDRAMLVMNEVAPDMQVVPHSHDFDQIAVVVQGRMRFTIGGETVDVGAGEVLLIPAGVEHAGEVLGDEPALNLDVFAPARDDYRHLLAWMDEA
jgi:quercetin dioxygenase-like cupin family protein